MIKRNESLAENKIKSEIEQLLLKYKNENIIYEYGKHQNKWNEFFLNLSQRLDFKISYKQVTLQNLSIYYI